MVLIKGVLAECHTDVSDQIHTPSNIDLNPELMNAHKYPPLNVLISSRGFPESGLKHHITPYRFQKQYGEKHFIKKVRQVTRHCHGGIDQYHYTVQTKENKYFRLLFDLHTLTWLLVDEVAPDRAIP